MIKSLLVNFCLNLPQIKIYKIYIPISKLINYFNFYVADPLLVDTRAQNSLEFYFCLARHCHTVNLTTCASDFAELGVILAKYYLP